MSRLAASALFLIAPLASAQTLADAWPLVPGNSWSYVLNSGVSAGSGRTYSEISGGAVWTATDSVDTVLGRLPGLSVNSVECVVRGSVDAYGYYSFDLLDQTAQAPCAVSRESFPRFDGEAPGVFVFSERTPRDVTIGGETVAGRMTLYGWAERGSVTVAGQLDWAAADGIGVLGFGSSSGRPSLAFTSSGSLRQATIQGETIRQPLETRTDFWPLAAGNRWEFLVVDRAEESVGAVAWTVETDGTGLALRLEHVQNGTSVSTTTCPLSLIEASRATGWQTGFSLGECTLPEALLAPSVNGTAETLRIDLFAAGATVTTGSETLTADIAKGNSVQGNFSTINGTTFYSVARNIGPISYDVDLSNDAPAGQSSGRWRATLAYASVGSTTYGTRVVAGEGTPTVTEALALSVGPNPVRASAQVAFSLPAATEAHIDVLDALGRTVQRLDLGARSAGAQMARLDVSGLAAGVYSVRLVAGDVQTATRISVVR